MIYDGSILDLSTYDGSISVSIFSQIAKENKKRFAGVPKYGGWVLDNCPIIKELWLALIEKGIAPDLVICLSDMENDGW